MDISTSTTILAILSTLGVTSCNSPIQDSQAEQHSAKNKSLGETTLQQDSEKDTIHYDDTYYPDDTVFMGKLLQTEKYHDEEVWKNADQEKWFGLFQTASGCYLAETKIKAERVHDVVIDEDEIQKTGWEISTPNKDSTIVLISRLGFLSNHPVKQQSFHQQYIYPGDSIKFNYLGVDYKLFATGGKKKIQDDPVWMEVWNYKFYIKSEKNGQAITELLVATPYCNDNMIEILFAGDIDGDGLLDLLIDTSGHYNSSCPTLYLSKPAEKGHLLKVVGKQISVGC